MADRLVGWRCPDLPLHTEYIEAATQTEAEEEEDGYFKEKRKRMKEHEEAQRAEVVEAATPITRNLKEAPPAYRSYSVKAFSKLNQVEGMWIQGDRSEVEE